MAGLDSQRYCHCLMMDQSCSPATRTQNEKPVLHISIMRPTQAFIIGKVTKKGFDKYRWCLCVYLPLSPALANN